MIVVLAELAPIVSCADTGDAVAPSFFDDCIDGGLHSVRNGLRREPVNDNFEHGDRIGSEFAFDSTSQGWTEGIVRRSDHAIVLGAHL